MSNPSPTGADGQGTRGRGVRSRRVRSLDGEANGASGADGRTAPDGPAATRRGRRGKPAAVRVRADGDGRIELLTRREVEVLEALAHGHSTTEVAQLLSIAPLTVSSHIKNIHSKLGVHSKFEAVSLALQHHLIHVPGGGSADRLDGRADGRRRADARRAARS